MQTVTTTSGQELTARELTARELTARELTVLLEQVLVLPVADDGVLELCHQIRTLAEACDDHEAAFQAAWLLGQHFEIKREPEKVLETLEPFLEVPFSLSPERRAEVLVVVSKASDALEQVNKTLRYANEALVFFRDRQDSRKQLELHACLGSAFTFLCSFHEALEHHMRALALAETLNDREAMTNSYIDLGWTYCCCDEYAKAEQYLLLALNMARDLNKPMLEARALGNLGNVYGYLNDHQAGLEFNQQATMIYEQQQNGSLTMIGYGNIGYSYVELGQPDLALPYFQKAMAQLEKVPNSGYAAWLETQMGKLFLESDPARAIGYLERALKRMAENGSLEGATDVHLALSELYEKSDLVKALEHHKAFAALEIKQLKDMNEKRTQALTVQFEVARLQQERELVQLKNVELARANEQLEELSLRDALTGLYNRRHLDTQLAKLHLEAQAQMHGTAQPFAVLVSDIDDFKRVNDLFSHLIGDEVLKVVAKLFVDQVRALDLVVRYGGEEFVLVLCQVTLEQALMIAEKLRAKVEVYPWQELHPDLQITVSIGICADTTLEHHERMLAVADDKMYVAKRNGKNQVQA
jgi:diguanylate cyclase (GGDEF)-like protein